VFFSLRARVAIRLSLSKRGRVILAWIKFTNPSTELHLRLKSLFHANVRQLSWNTSQRYVMISQCLGFLTSVLWNEDVRSRLSSALNFRIRIRGIRIARHDFMCALCK